MENEKEQVPPQYAGPQFQYGGQPPQFQQGGQPPQSQYGGQLPQFQQGGQPPQFQQGFQYQQNFAPQYGQPGMPQNPGYVFSSSTLIGTTATGTPLANPPSDYMAWSTINLVLSVLFSYIGICVSYIALTHSRQTRLYSMMGDEVMAHSHSQSAKNANIGASALIFIGIGALVGVIVYYTSYWSSWIGY